MRKSIVGLGITLLIALAAILVYRYVQEAEREARVAQASANLRRIGQAMQMYANAERAGGFPSTNPISFAPDGTPSIPATQPESGDVGADVVAAFYHALLQKDPPTAAQEHALLEREALAYGLVLKHPDPRDSIEPMDRTSADFARLKAYDAQVEAAGPVVLNYFRQHKEWFLPKKMRSFDDISISRTITFARRGDQILRSPHSNDGWVIVIFTDDRSAPPEQQRTRTVFFMLEAGKIAADSIGLDGFPPTRTPVKEFLKANPIWEH